MCIDICKKKNHTGTILCHKWYKYTSFHTLGKLTNRAVLCWWKLMALLLRPVSVSVCTCFTVSSPALQLTILPVHPVNSANYLDSLHLNDSTCLSVILWRSMIYYISTSFWTELYHQHDGFFSHLSHLCFFYYIHWVRLTLERGEIWFTWM